MYPRGESQGEGRHQVGTCAETPRGLVRSPSSPLAAATPRPKYAQCDGSSIRIYANYPRYLIGNADPGSPRVRGQRMLPAWRSRPRNRDGAGYVRRFGHVGIAGYRERGGK